MSGIAAGHDSVRSSPRLTKHSKHLVRGYLLAFKEELKTVKDPEGLINAMKKKFPSAGLLLALERGAKANVERRQTN
jgi:hypothetical protein